MPRGFAVVLAPGDPVIRSVWLKLPVALRAIVVGTLVFQVLQLPQLLLLLQAELWPAIPWTVVLALALLWLGWRWFAGAGWPAGTSAERRRRMRIGASSPRRLRRGYLAALAVLVHLVGLAMVTSSVIRFPPESFTPPAFLTVLPTGAALAVVLAFAAIAAVSEEAGFRGYLQTALERRYGSVAAVLITAILFWLAHYDHASFLHRAPILISSGIFTGWLALHSRTLGPPILVHFLADTIGFTTLMGFFGLPPLYGVSTVQDTGLNAGFVVAVLMMVGGAWASVAMLKRIER